MGQVALQISDIDVNKLIDELNAALSEEWLAYYQYWIGARIMEGPMRSEIEPELLVHANEELAHATLLVNRIIQLEGKPVLNPAEWFEKAKCAYESPEDPYIERILEQNLTGERCAIRRYQELAQMTQGRDYVTNQLAVTILKDEIEHENDIESWMNDIHRMKTEMLKMIKMSE